LANFSLFGFKIGKNKETSDVLPSFSPPVLDDGAVTITAAAHYGTSIDLESNYKNDVELITRYREMAMQPEIESAIDDIINESIIQEDTPAVEIILDDIKTSPKVKAAIEEEFKNILTLLNFKALGQDIFRRFYVDGRLNYNIILDKENPGLGIQELRYIDPRKLSKIRELIKSKDPVTGFSIITGYNDFFIYSDNVNTKSNLTQSGLKIAPDSIINVTSGLMDAKRSVVLSYLHKCITGDGRVKTPSGWTYMKDLIVGDKVYSFNTESNVLEETVVTNKWDNGIKDVLSIRTRHTKLNCTPDHLILVLDKKTNVTEYIEAKDLIVKQHQLLLPKGIVNNTKIKFPISEREIKLKVSNYKVWCDFNIKNKKKLIYKIADDLNQPRAKIYAFIYGQQSLSYELALKIQDKLPIKLDLEEKLSGYCLNKLNLPNEVNVEFARLFGFLIGDGWVNKYTIGFAEGVVEELNIRYKSSLELFFGNCSRINANNRKSIYGSYYTNNTLGCELLNQMGFIAGSQNKRIPKWVFEASPEIQEAFIIGLMDADGCERTNTTYNGIWAYTINLANKKLIEDIKELWTNLGYCSGKIHTIKQYPTTILGLEVKKLSGAWSITICKKLLPTSENIIEIKSDGFDTVYDIEVEHNEHNFIVNGSPVHNCIKPLNQLRMIEDATIIYKVSRAPERRIFYIDVGNLPKMKAEQYLKDIMTKYKNKVVYDASTGQIRDDRNYLSMQEDFWLPRRSDNKSTEITTLPSSAAFDDMSMVEYFEKKLYKALSVPYSRLHQSDSAFSIGRSQEITRDEVKFAKFITRLQSKFVDVFDQALRIQCILKNICTADEFEEYKQHINYKFEKDNNYEELKEAELTQNRVALLTTVDAYTGKYYSQAWIQKNVLCMSDDDIRDIKKQIDQEIAEGLYPDPKLIAAQEISSLTGQDQQQTPVTDNTQPAPDTQDQQPAPDTQDQQQNPYYNAKK
jgi:intein/homing endonuclease